MKKGFSLVELSVVLVIIGLLISGILVGKSMVQTARVEATVRDLHQYEIAVNNFTQARKYYPGDDPNLSPAGDGNGIMNDIDTGNSTGMGSVPVPDPNQVLGPIEIVPHDPIHPFGRPPSCQGSDSGDEATQAFAQMSDLNMLPTSYSAFAPSQCGGGEDDVYYNNAGTNAPYSTVDNDVVSIFGAGPKLPFKGMKDAVRANYYIYFITSAKDVKPLETKLGSHTHYDNAVGLVNFNGEGQCDDGQGDQVACTTQGQQLEGSLGYFIPGGDM